MSHYSFPILSDREVAQCLNELGLNASVELLSKPTFEFVQPIYENLVAALMGISREELQQPVFAAIDALEFPELHDESIPAIAFLNALNRLMLASGIKDFSLRDLYKPEAARLRRNLSAVINFAKFREEKLAAYTQLQESFDALQANKDTAEKENKALQAKLKALKEAREAEIPEVERVEAETMEIFSENQALNKQQAALASEVRTLKAQANSLTDEASQLRYKLSQARSTGEDLRAQIVQSPQKIEAMVEEMSSAVERERVAFADAERRIRELASRLEIASRLEKDIAKVVALMEETEVEISKKKEVSKQVKALRSEVATSEHEASQLAAQHQHLKRQQAALIERIERVRAQCEVKRQAAEGKVEEQLRNKEAIEAENAAALAKLAENEAMIQSLRERISEIKTSHETELNHVLDQYSALRDAVAQYHADMEVAMAGEEGFEEETDPQLLTGNVSFNKSPFTRPIDLR